MTIAQLAARTAKLATSPAHLTACGIATKAVANIMSVTTLSEDQAESFRNSAWSIARGNGPVQCSGWTQAAFAADGLTTAPRKGDRNEYGTPRMTVAGKALAARIVKWESATKAAKLAA